jgi:hypothetical protein
MSVFVDKCGRYVKKWGAAMEVESIPSVYETDNLPLIYAATWVGGVRS